MTGIKIKVRLWDDVMVVGCELAIAIAIGVMVWCFVGGGLG